MGIGIHTQALVIKHFAVGALTPTDKEDQVVFRGKLRDIWHAVGHITTDRIKALEGCLWGYMTLDIVDDAMKLVERFRGLRIQIDIA